MMASNIDSSSYKTTIPIILINQNFPKLQVFAAFASSLGIVSDGMQVGWTAPIVSLLETSNVRIKISKFEITWLENIFLLGVICGLAFTHYADKFGRKKFIIICNVLKLIGWIITSMATSVFTLYIGRFIAGVAYIAASVVVPMYIAEISDKRIRGTLGAFVSITTTFGLLLVNALVPYVSILMSSLIGALFPLISLVAMLFMPESPTYLLSVDNIKDARNSMIQLRSDNVEFELEQMLLVAENEKLTKGKPFQLFTDKKNRKPLIITLVLFAISNLSGVLVVMMNMQSFLHDVKSTLPPNMVAVTSYVLMLVVSIGTITLFDKFGRKIMLNCSSLITGTCMLLLGTFCIFEKRIQIEQYGWIPAVLVVIYIVTYKFGLGTVPNVIIGELYSTNVKALGMTISIASSVLWSMLSLYLYNTLSADYGIYIPLFIFAINCYATVVFSILYIPETKQKSLEEIQLILKEESLEQSKNYNTI